MATDLRESWWGRHFEKVVVLATGLVFIASVVLWVVLRESRVEKREVIRRLIQQIGGRDEDTIEKVLPEEEQRQLGLTKLPLTVAEFKRRLAQRPPKWPEGDFVWGIPTTGPPPLPVEKVVTPPKQILAVEEVQTAAGRGVTPEAVSHPMEKMAEQGLSDVAWVSCVGKFNLDLQLEQYLAGRVEPQPIVITRVEMSRRERKPDGAWSDWEAVTGQGAKAAIDKLPRRPENSRDSRAVIAWARGLLAVQEEVRRIPFVVLVARDAEGKWVHDIAGDVKGVEQPSLRVPAGAGAPATPAAPGLSPEAAVPSGAGPAAPAAPTSAAWWLTEPTGPVAPTPAGPTLTGPVEPQYTYAKVWAHDLSVRPGRTYQYRMRVTVFNPVYSHPDCGDEQAKWTPERVGEWSEPSVAVTIPRLVYFYFVGVSGDRANLELHRWIHGQWVIVRSVSCRVGTPVVCSKLVPIKVPGSGKDVTETVDLSPGVLLVDMIRGFPYTPTGMKAIPTNVMVFSDTQGNLGQRIDWEDKKEANQRRQEREAAAPAVVPATKKGG
ncbi:MAG: hypothetical protein NTX40_07820 [Planctomycetota bacterium]|nr:hypothetical protein [Planctomycetota bacterium]